MMPGIDNGMGFGHGAIDRGYVSPASLFSLQGNQTELSIHDLQCSNCIRVIIKELSIWLINDILTAGHTVVG